jgi:D-Tyr-tRNAtyr deacylase
MGEEYPRHKGGSAVWYVIVIQACLSSFSHKAVPQFTLQDALEKGEMYEKADALAVRQLYDYFIEQLREAYQPDQVNNGVLETKMDVELLDDTPIRFDYHSADETV